jgi:hypothetical protein
MQPVFDRPEYGMCLGRARLAMDCSATRLVGGVKTPGFKRGLKGALSPGNTLDADLPRGGLQNDIPTVRCTRKTPNRERYGCVCKVDEA